MRPLARETTHERRSRRPVAMAAGGVLFISLITTAAAPIPAFAGPLPPRAPRLAIHEPHRTGQRPPLFLACPVDRPRTYFAGDFGSPRYAGGFHRHQGVDILAPRGTKIRAPFDGVAKASSNWAGGLAVYLYGRKGFVYNAHLSRLGALGQVRAGAVIGHVGNSGDASGGSPHDHFEWHPGGEAAVDPYPHLQQACARQPGRADRPRRGASRIRFLLAKLMEAAWLG